MHLWRDSFCVFSQDYPRVRGLCILRHCIYLCVHHLKYLMIKMCIDTNTTYKYTLPPLIDTNTTYKYTLPPLIGLLGENNIIFTSNICCNYDLCMSYL